MLHTQIIPRHYKDLITTVRQTLSQGLFDAQKALEYQRLTTYWHIGKHIRDAVDASGGELYLGEPLYQAISDDLKAESDLDLSVDFLRRMVQFNKNYPELPENTPLTFTHYVALQRIHDPRMRKRLEQKAITHDMSALEIKSEIAQIVTPSVSVLKRSKKTRIVERGEPFVYRMHMEPGLDGKERLCVDCGFKINIDSPEKKNISSYKNRIVRSIKNKEGYGLRLFKYGMTKCYTYPAVVSRVVDGDTIDARIDIGFGIRLNERLRLKGINTPELTTATGRRAKQFLTRHFSRCPIVIIRSTKAGMYGRWLADIFTLNKCSDPYKIAQEGIYLNQIMLDKGMAEVYD